MKFILKLFYHVGLQSVELKSQYLTQTSGVTFFARNPEKRLRLNESKIVRSEIATVSAERRSLNSLIQPGHNVSLGHC